MLYKELMEVEKLKNSLIHISKRRHVGAFGQAGLSCNNELAHQTGIRDLKIPCNTEYVHLHVWTFSTTHQTLHFNMLQHHCILRTLWNNICTVVVF